MYHLMETSDWLVSYADPDLRDRIRPLYLAGAGAMAEDAVRQADARRAEGVELETTEGQTLALRRVARPDANQRRILAGLGIELPERLRDLP